MDDDIFRDLKHLDERLHTVDQFLEACTSLFDEHYSEANESEGIFSWPYSIKEESVEPDWPTYRKPPSKLSPSTTALCGWAVSRLSRLGSEDQKAKRQTAASEAAKNLASLPPSRLTSKTWKEVGEVFLHAQVLRFLASQNQFTGELFEYVYDRVSQIIDQGKELKRHPFFFHYCVLAWEQVRIPAIKVAEGVVEICELADKIAKLPPIGTKDSLPRTISLFELTSGLLDALESFTTLVSSLRQEPETLKNLATRTKTAIIDLTSAITGQGHEQIDVTLAAVQQIVKESINEAHAALDALPARILELTPEEKKDWTVVPGASNDLLPKVARRIKKKAWYGKRFQARLTSEVVQQVSYASSGNESRLDIGALAYSLAAAVRIDALQLSSPLARKALAIVFEYQRGGRWNQVQPMSRTAVGFIHVPLNIEIANALLSILLKDLDAGSQALQPVHASAMAGELKKSWSQIDEIMCWVSDTVNRVREFAGWCNEHDFAPDRIDLWVTAQVAQFLLDYREILNRLVIRSTLERAGLTTKGPRSVDTTWGDLKPTDLEKPYDEQVKNMLRERFVLPIERVAGRRSSSVLLYGPPGTSKTSTMEALANRLGWRFLQMTPADFLSTGGEQVEARATLLFEILRRAKNLVVLLDEVDEFLLDREAKDRPGGIFRFMTTSMLPKLQALKSAGSIVFGIATNYEERLDKAIIRQGRVDYYWAIFPPDFTSRMLLIGGKFKIGVSDAEARPFAAKTPFFNYPELKGTLAALSVTEDPAKAVRHPTASPDSYSNRPGSDDEFLALLNSQITKALDPVALAKLKDQLRELERKAKEKLKKGEPLFTEDTVDKLREIIGDETE